ncbi:hypothetical protein JKG47_12620 [Acidithiobacillus sp. MC6.1]|nr:hypothetical protein [Acidithiobacillus sp. MC6.1]
MAHIPKTTPPTENVPALKTEAYFQDRQARGDLAAFDDWLATSPDVPPSKGDDLD